jgi:lysine-specific demethylase 8
VAARAGAAARGYLDDAWRVELRPFAQFVEALVDAAERADAGAGAGAAAGYLAQHRLFDQVPSLRGDIDVPDYCCCSDGGGGGGDRGGGGDAGAGAGDEPTAQAWRGPAGTVSPLHFDAPHNVLAQAVGVKRVILFAPSAAPRLSPLAGAMRNSAAADPEREGGAGGVPADVEALECVLVPGDALYIPPRWWHQVRALTTSFSVSWWWGGPGGAEAEAEAEAEKEAEAEAEGGAA